MAAVTRSWTQEPELYGLKLLLERITLPLYESFWGTLNYMIAYLAGLTAAANVGAWTTMASVALVGASILYIPAILLNWSLNWLGFNPTWLSTLLEYAFYFGSIATGAAFFGLVVEPFIMCALITPAIGLLISSVSFLFVGVLGYFFSSTVHDEHLFEQEDDPNPELDRVGRTFEDMLRQGNRASAEISVFPEITGRSERHLQMNTTLWRRQVRVANEEIESEEEDERAHSEVRAYDSEEDIHSVHSGVHSFDSQNDVPSSTSSQRTNSSNGFFAQAARQLAQDDASSGFDLDRDALVSP